MITVKNSIFSVQICPLMRLRDIGVMYVVYINISYIGVVISLRRHCRYFILNIGNGIITKPYEHKKKHLGVRICNVLLSVK